MVKAIFMLSLLLVSIISACAQVEEQRCKDFRDCLPESVHPGQTGCGGCYPDGEDLICYELDRALCESYMQNYSCVEGYCPD